MTRCFLDFPNQSNEEVRFIERIINMVLRLISDNWYSILVNRNSFCFFSSSRGLKQGDPLSPTFFIIVTKLLTSILNKLNKDDGFKEFGLPK